MGSIRALGTAVQNRTSTNEDEIALEKIAFETNKKELQQVMNNVLIEIENTDLDVIRKGSQFMESHSTKSSFAHLPRNGSKDRPATGKQINLLSNILKQQARSLSPKQYGTKRPKRIPRMVDAATQIEQEDVFEVPIQAANIRHYKPQELIRLELENSQIKEEKETLNGYV